MVAAASLLFFVLEQISQPSLIFEQEFFSRSNCTIPNRIVTLTQTFCRTTTTYNKESEDQINVIIR